MTVLFVTVPVEDMACVGSTFFKDLFGSNPGVKVGWEGVQDIRDEDGCRRHLTMSVRGAEELVGLPSYAQVSATPPVGP